LHLAPKTGAYRELWIDGERQASAEHASEDEPLYGKTYLPRKFKIGIALPGDNCVDAYTQDIALVADLEENEVRGFGILVGGGMGMTHGKKETYPRLATPLCFVTPGEALEVVEAIVKVFHDWGDRANRKHARFKYVVEEHGIDWVRAEVERRIGRPLAIPRKFELTTVDDHLGWHAQPNGRWTLGIFVENGRIEDRPHRELKTALRMIVERFRPAIRLTGQQNILLADVAPQNLAEMALLFASHGIRIDPREHGIRRHSMACPALPTCGLGLTDAERVLPSVVTEIQTEMERLGIAERALSIRMTGCPNGCARPYMGDIGFVGRSKDLYDVFAGGDWANTRLNWVIATSVRLEQLAATISPLLQRWRDEGRDDESFGDFLYRAETERRLLTA
jgi:sulfite reductase (ferredoxin)